MGLTVGVVLAAAVLGNVFIGGDAQRWFRSLRWPRLLVPYPAFYAVGAVYYLLMGVVLYRALDRQDRLAVVLAVVVLALNEAWNLLLFGRRSLRGGFLGVLGFLVPLLVLQVVVLDDAVAAVLVAIYVVWVAYDVVWLYQMWRLNSDAGHRSTGA